MLILNLQSGAEGNSGGILTRWNSETFKPQSITTHRRFVIISDWVFSVITCGFQSGAVLIFGFGLWFIFLDVVLVLGLFWLCLVLGWVGCVCGLLVRLCPVCLGICVCLELLR